MGFLTGKTAIITGAGRAVLSDGRCGSIGYGIATAYAKEGANLVITGRNVQKLTDAKEELERLYGIKVLPVQADVSAGAGKRYIWANRCADQQCTGFCIRSYTGRSYAGTVRSGNVFRIVCSILLYAGMLPILERDKRKRYQLCFRCGTFR